MKDIQIGHNDMTDEEIFKAGRDGYLRGWINAPPYSIASIPRNRNIQKSAAQIWQDGWKYEQGITYSLSAI